jgi:hypothetical protein
LFSDAPDHVLALLKKAFSWTVVRLRPMNDSRKMGSPKAVVNPFLFELTRCSIFFALHGIYAHAKLGCVYFNQADNR